jgi:iron complex outermembrane receptor protein
MHDHWSSNRNLSGVAMNSIADRSSTPSILLSCGICACLLVVPCTAVAEEEDRAALFDDLTVTGSSVPTAADALPNRVTIIDSNRIKASGLDSNLLDVLRKLVPSFEGRSNIGNSNARNDNQNTAGGSQAMLLNMDTLVLINGRRVAIDAVASLIGGKTFVDLNRIPVVAVDRIEILADGASSVYGSDAVGGVINVILKSDYVGGEIGERFGQANDYIERSQYFLLGKSIENIGISAIGSVSHTDPLFARSRSFTPSSQYLSLLVAQDKKAVSLNFNDDLSSNGRLVLYSDLQYASVSSSAQRHPVTFNGFSDNAMPNEIRDDDVSVRWTVGLKGNMGGGWGWDTAYVYCEDKVQQDRTNLIYKHNFNALGAGGYDAAGNVDASGQYSLLYNGTSASSGTVLVPKVANPSSLPTVDLAALSGLLFGTEHLTMSSRINSWDGKLHGTIGGLPAGKPAFVVGLARREEGLEGDADPNGRSSVNGDAGPLAQQTVQQWIGGSFHDHYNGDRIVEAAFGEVRVPITSSNWNVANLYSLDLIGALRVEHYSDAGWSSVPRAAFMWQPFDAQLTLRGGVSKSFTAPPMVQVDGPSDTRMVGSGVLAGLFPGTTNNGFNGADLTNPKLRPSTALARTISASYRPNRIPGLTLGAEFHDIEQSDTPGGIGFNVILDSVNRLGQASPYSSLAAFGAFPGQIGAMAVNAGDITACIHSAGKCSNLYAVDYWINKGSANVKFSTFTVSYARPIQGYGLVSIDSAATFINSYRVRDFSNAPWYQYAGTTSSSYGTLPRWHFYNNLTWQIARYSVSVAQTYIDSVQDMGAGGSIASAPARVNAYQTYDLRLAYHGGPVIGQYGRAWAAALGVNNLTDRMPPSSATFLGVDGVSGDISSYSPIGRFVYLEGSFKF